MREILFRGKSVYTGKWAVSVCPHGVMRSGHLCDDFILETVGQYTGLTDKNGTKIFEGDIVEHHLQGDILVNRGVVNWDKENARWAYQLNTMNPCFALYNPKAFEVIGNIHDNPELIGGTEDGE